MRNKKEKDKIKLSGIKDNKLKNEKIKDSVNVKISKNNQNNINLKNKSNNILNINNKESQSQQAVGYSLSLKLENNRSKLRGITLSLSNKNNFINKNKTNGNLITSNNSASNKILSESNKALTNNILPNRFSTFSILIILTILLASISFVILSSQIISAQSTPQVSYCCERTKTGAYCQNSPLEACDSAYRSTPTSCEATSFCKRGCCYDSDEGLCMENVPEEACKADNGIWSDQPECQIPQCELGCCILGQQASFTSLQRCKKLSGEFGLGTDFRRDIADELACIDIATSQDVGACIFESEFVNTCKFTTRSECNSQKLGTGVSNSTSIAFYKDFLCTAPDFNTNCQKTKTTTCLEGHDEVYFLDTCGNPGNVYDSAKADSVEYWTKVFPKDELCGADSGNTNSKTCGNCEYLGGSICGKAENLKKPTYGDYICQDTNCKKTANGKSYKNGESWCFYDNGKPTEDSVGSRHFRHICFMGEEMVEPCSDYRQQVCIEQSIGGERGVINSGAGGFSQAGCAPNRWQDCILQNKSEDCLNEDQRDCSWMPIDLKDPDLKKGVTGLLKSGITKVTSQLGGGGDLISGLSKDKENGRCVPKISPGLQFWDSSSASQCSLASQTCIVRYTKGLLESDWKCKDNCECLEATTKVLFNKICTQYGDCGAQSNYIGKFTSQGLEVTVTENKDGTQQETPQQTRQQAQPGGSQTFGGPSQAGTFPAGSNPTTPTTGSGNQPAPPGGNGNVIQGLVVNAYNKMRGTG